MSLPRLDKRGLLVLAVCLLMAGVAAYWWSDSGARVVNHVRKIGWTDIRTGWFLPDDSTTLTRPDSVPVFAYWYRPEGVPCGAVVLLHGNTPLGQRLGLYRLLGRRLADLGYVVLAPDFAGFGKSGDPFRTGRATSLDPRIDVVAAVNELEVAHPGMPVHIIAHSGGAAGALPVALEDPRMRSLVLIGPPRRVAERLATEDQRDYFFRRASRNHRQVYGHDLPDWFTEGKWVAQVMKTGSSASLQIDLDAYARPLAGDHLPLLVIDNAWEDSLDLKYVDDYMEEVSEPREHIRIAESDHYLNTARSRRSMLLYDAGAADQTMEAIGRFLKSSTGRSVPRECR